MSDTVRIIKYPVNDAEFYISGRKLNLIRSAAEIITETVTELRAFGDSEPSRVYTSQMKYTLEFVRDLLSAEEDFPWGEGFDIGIVRENGAVIYDGCRLVKTETVHSEGEPIAEKLTVSAYRRRETQNE